MTHNSPRQRMMDRILFTGSLLFSAILLGLPFIKAEAAISDGWGVFAGRLHILIIHFPIVLILSLMVVWLAIHFLKKGGFSIIMPWLWIIAILACLASVTAGYLLYRSGEYEGELVQNHFWGGIITTISTLWGGLAYFKTLRSISTQWERVHTILLLLATVSVIYTGHMGGSLTHGSDFLTEAIPIKTRDSTLAGGLTKKPESLLVFQDMLLPVLKSHCTNCHNAHKKKGGLVLNSFEELQLGGESGKPVVVGFMPDSSELYRRVILPIDHDDRMPPEGKKGLESEELTILKWWIEQGADPLDTLGAGPEDPEKREAIYRYLPELTRQRQIMIAEAEARKKLIPELSRLGSRLGLVIRPDPETDSTLFAVSMRFPPGQIKDATLEELSDYGPVFSRISLVASEITDDGLFYLSRMNNLQRLMLQMTCITGEGLTYLKDLPRLEILNLSQTNLTNEWAMQLSEFPVLKEVYVFNTLADANVIEALDKHLVSIKVSFEEGPYY